MPKFKKKPIEVDAEQYLGKPMNGVSFTPPNMANVILAYTVTKSGQYLYLKVGDWVISEPDGNGFAVCKDEVFRDTYDAVKDPFHA